jgi:hypothetical protein
MYCLDEHHVRPCSCCVNPMPLGPIVEFESVSLKLSERELLLNLDCHSPIHQYERSSTSSNYKY